MLQIWCNSVAKKVINDNFMIMENFYSISALLTQRFFLKYAVTSSFYRQLNAPERFISILSLHFILWARHVYINFTYVLLIWWSGSSGLTVYIKEVSQETFAHHDALMMLLFAPVLQCFSHVLQHRNPVCKWLCR